MVYNTQRQEMQRLLSICEWEKIVFISLSFSDYIMQMIVSINNYLSSLKQNSEEAVWLTV